MPVPTYDQFIEPVLRYLAAHPDGALARDVHDAAAGAQRLSETDRAELLPSGVQAVYKNRAGRAHDRLKRAGHSASLRRGYWKLTPEGMAFARTNREPLSPEAIEDLATQNTDVRLRPSESEEQAAVTRTDSMADTPATASPDDRLEQALGELKHSVAAELLEVLSQVSPQYFETIVLGLLHRMGYGASRADLQRVGGVGDGGIDGVISLDRLGLEKVYVQAKRWQGSVGRPDVQGFYGALAGQRANKGVFITTSTFSPQALEFARSVERIVLIDGAKLDSDYFEG